MLVEVNAESQHGMLSSPNATSCKRVQRLFLVPLFVVRPW